MPFCNSRNSNFVMKFRRNCDIDLYFLQFPINIDFCQGAVESSRGAVVDQNEFGGAEADHRPLTKINIYRKLQKNIPKI